MCKWNLSKLAESLEPVIDIAESMAYLENNYDLIYN